MAPQLGEFAQGSTLLHFARNGSFGPDGQELMVVERGEGAYVFDTHGNRYVDGLSSLFCAQIGYSFGEEMGAVAANQLQQLAFSTIWGRRIRRRSSWPTGSPGSPRGHQPRVLHLRRLEAVEAAWKLARQYHVANGEPQRLKAIARDIAYHGVTLGALSFTGVPAYKEQFGPPAIYTRHVSNTNAFRSEEQGEELTEKLLGEIEDVILEEGPDTIAVIIAEPVQNAGGCLVPPPGYWQGLRRLADEYGILLHADEVITGFGRLGECFGVTRYDAVPDLITVAKGLTSAYAPMGAVLVADKVAAPLYEDERTLMHGITFGGHPLCAAIALKNLEIFEREGVLENVRAHEDGLAGTPRAAAGAADRRRRARHGLLLAVDWSRTPTTRASTPTSASACCAATCGPAARGGPDRPRR